MKSACVGVLSIIEAVTQLSRSQAGTAQIYQAWHSSTSRGIQNQQLRECSSFKTLIIELPLFRHLAVNSKLKTFAPITINDSDRDEHADVETGDVRRERGKSLEKSRSDAKRINTAGERQKSREMKVSGGNGNRKKHKNKRREEEKECEILVYILCRK